MTSTTTLSSLLLLFFCLDLSQGFLPKKIKAVDVKKRISCDPQRSTSQLYIRPEWVRKASGVQPTTQETKMLGDALERRQESLRWVGETFVCRRQGHPIYLYIPKTDLEAADESNIVGHLDEGEEVTVAGPLRGNWVDHDGGGWSQIESAQGDIQYLEQVLG